MVKPVFFVLWIHQIGNAELKNKTDKYYKNKKLL